MVRPHQVHCWTAAPVQTALAMTWSWALPLRGRAQDTGHCRAALDRGGGGGLSRGCSRGGKALRASCCQCVPPGSGPCTSSSCNCPCSQVDNCPCSWVHYCPCTASACNCPCTSSACHCPCTSSASNCPCTISSCKCPCTSSTCNCPCTISSCNCPCSQVCNCPCTSSASNRPCTLSSCNYPFISSSCNCPCSLACNCTYASSSCNCPCPQACSCSHASLRPSTSLALRCAACTCLDLCWRGNMVYSIMILVHIAVQVMQICLKKMGSRLSRLFRGFWMTTELRM